MRTKRSVGVIATAALALSLSVAFAPAAFADRGRDGGGAWNTQTGNLQCNTVPATLIGTTSRARGNNITHQNTTIPGGVNGANVGSSSVYANWGFTFWVPSSKRLSVSSTGSLADVPSIGRYCTWL